MTGNSAKHTFYTLCRRALLEFRDRGGEGGGEAGGAGGPAHVDGHNQRDDGGAALRQRVVELEDENSRLRQLVDDQARQLEELNGRFAALENTGHRATAAKVLM